MASGTIKGSFTGVSQDRAYPQIEWSSTKNVSANNSSVIAILYFYRPSASQQSWNAYGNNMTITINGSGGTASRTFDLRNTSKQEIWRRTITVNHNADGKKTINISASGTTGVSLGNFNFSGSAKLDDIPRAYSFIISTQTMDMGSNLTVKVNNNGSGFEGWLYMKFGSKKVKLSGPTPLGSNFNVSPSIADFAPVIPNATSGTGGIVLETWQGNTKIGEASIALTLKVPTNIVPSISSVGVSDTSTVPDKVGAFYVQSQSKLKLATAGVGIYGSTVKSVSHTVDGKTIGTGTDTTVDLASTNIAAGAKKIITTLTDSRGRTATKETSITITAYSAPQITSFRAERDSKTQTTVNVAKAVSVSPIGTNKNTYTVKTEFKLATATDWTTFKTESNAIEATTNITGIDITKSYDIRLTIADKFNSISSTLSVSTAKTLLSMYKDVGVGIGKIYEEGHGSLDVADDIWMKGSKLIDIFYPIGSIYQSVNSSNPSSFMGGTWERYGKGKVLVSLDEADADFATVGKTGGEKEHTLTVAEMPSHAHKQEGNGGGTATTGYMTPIIRNVNGGNTYVNNNTKPTGGGDAHNNLQPYTTVYMWHRTA